MGNQIGSAVAGNMKQMQKEMQEEMMQKQLANQLRMQERMRRQMIAQQMAFTRDLVTWMGGAYTALLTGITGYTIANKKFPKPALVPVFVFGTVLAYQADFAYGNKIERVDRMMREDILTNKDYWFVPLDPGDQFGTNKLKQHETEQV